MITVSTLTVLDGLRVGVRFPEQTVPGLRGLHSVTIPKGSMYCGIPEVTAPIPV